MALHIEDCSWIDVKVVDDRILKCDRRCPCVKLMLQDQEIVADFFLLLDDYEAVLGIEWLTMLGRLGFERGALEELEPPSRHPPYWANRLGLASEREFYLSFSPHMKERILKAGDMEFKQNKFLPAEKQVVTCNPDVNTVLLFFFLPPSLIPLEIDRRRSKSTVTARQRPTLLKSNATSRFRMVTGGNNRYLVVLYDSGWFAYRSVGGRYA
ncbi:hypothetical protein BHE74_00037387, partial [Ensete ventricosum]